MKRFGILTGGGDCPGLNPVIRGIVKKGLKQGVTLIGFHSGWKGILEADAEVLTKESISGILHRGGTILKTSRTNPFAENKEENLNKIKETFARFQLDGLIAIGGEDTLGVAAKLNEEGLSVVGVPKTIDNDLSCTDFTFGFDTSINIAMEALDRLHTTAESHSRIIVVEIMGRHAGWITLYAGLAGGADYILIPEKKVNIQDLAQSLKKRHQYKNFSIVAVSEGAELEGEELVLQDKGLDAFGHVRLGGVGDALAKKLEQLTGFETRSVVLGHLQRGGSPSAFDRVLGLRFGVKALELCLEGHFGKMVSLQSNEIVAVEIKDAVGTLKTVRPEFYELAKNFFS